MDADSLLYQMAAKQGGVVTRVQALEIGLSVGQIDHRVKAGRWRPFASSTYRLFDLDDPMARVRAAVAALPNAVASHETAGHVHGLTKLPEGSPIVSVHTQTTHQFPGVQVVRSHDVLDHHVEIRDGLRTTTPARTIVDLAARFSLGRLGAVVDSALSARLVTVADTRTVLDEVARRGKPGTKNLRKILGERDGPAVMGSVLEIRGIRALRERGISGFVQEHPVPWSANQRFDLAFPSERLAIEWDSRTWHSIQTAFEADRIRDRRALVHGWRVLRFTWTDVHERPDVVAGTIRSLLDRSHSVGR